MNRAVHGDVVVIQVLPESEWRGGTETIVEEGDLTKIENADEESEDPEIETEVEAREQRILQTSSTVAQRQVTARVVGIVKRNWRT